MQDLGSQRAAERFLERAQNKHGFGLIAVSLGYAETLLSVSGASTSSELSPHERAAAGDAPRQRSPVPLGLCAACWSSCQHNTVLFGAVCGADALLSRVSGEAVLALLATRMRALFLIFLLSMACLRRYRNIGVGIHLLPCQCRHMSAATSCSGHDTCWPSAAQASPAAWCA